MRGDRGVMSRDDRWMRRGGMVGRITERVLMLGVRCDRNCSTVLCKLALLVVRL